MFIGRGHCFFPFCFLTFAGKKVPIPGYEIQTLQRVVGEFEDISLIEKPLKIGDEVEIISGNLTGIRGVFLEQKNKRLFEISLDQNYLCTSKNFLFHHQSFLLEIDS